MAKWESKGKDGWKPVNDAAKKIAALTSVTTYVIQKAKGLYDRMVKEVKDAKVLYDDAEKQLKTAKEKYEEVLKSESSKKETPKKVGK